MRYVVLKVGPRESGPDVDSVSVINRQIFTSWAAADSRARSQQRWENEHGGAACEMHVVPLDPIPRTNLDKALIQLEEAAAGYQATADRMLHAVLEGDPDVDRADAARYASYATISRTMLTILHNVLEGKQ